MTKKNTYKNGQLTFYVLKTVHKTHVAACKELCIVVENKDRERAVLEMLANAKRYLKNIIAGKLGEHLLNQELPDEFYEEVKMAIEVKRLEDLTTRIESLPDVFKRRVTTLQRDLASC